MAQGPLGSAPSCIIRGREQNSITSDSPGSTASTIQPSNALLSGDYDTGADWTEGLCVRWNETPIQTANSGQYFLIK